MNLPLSSTELCAINGTATPKNAPRLTSEKITELLQYVPDWDVNEVNGTLQLQREFASDNFVASMAFASKITEIAEASDHHPALLVQYGSVQVSWWSHSINGLYLNDFVAAAKTDKAYSSL